MKMIIAFADRDGLWHGYNEAGRTEEPGPAFSVYTMKTLCGATIHSNSFKISQSRRSGNIVSNHPAPICRKCLMKIIEADAAKTITRLSKDQTGGW